MPIHDPNGVENVTPPPSHRKSFVVRTNGEYSISIEAADKEEALKRAEAIPVAEWDVAWSEYEAEEE